MSQFIIHVITVIINQFYRISSKIICNQHMKEFSIHVITAVMKQLERITSKVMMRQFIKLFAIHVIKERLKQHMVVTHEVNIEYDQVSDLNEEIKPHWNICDKESV